MYLPHRLARLLESNDAAHIDERVWVRVHQADVDLLLTIVGNPVCLQQVVDGCPCLRVLVEHTLNAVAGWVVGYKAEVDIARCHQLLEVEYRFRIIERVLTRQQVEERHAQRP